MDHRRCMKPLRKRMQSPCVTNCPKISEFIMKLFPARCAHEGSCCCCSARRIEGWQSEGEEAQRIK
eukprot:8721049-Karenia_brevis.AAC.1